MDTSDTATLRTTQGIDISIHSLQVLYKRYSLTGRCTQVLGATSQSLIPDTMQSLAKTPMVTKIYWPNEGRLNEEQIIQRAAETPGVSDHLPRVFGSCDGYRTAKIREGLGILRTTNQPCRVLRVLILERLCPITELQGESFIKAWLQCVLCEFSFIYVAAGINQAFNYNHRSLCSLEEWHLSPRPERLKPHAPDV
jgi:hypothetical protein